MRPRLGTRLTAHLVLAFVCLCFLAPIAWLLNAALKTGPELAAFPTVWAPEHPQWHNFRDATQVIAFFGYARNSLVISTLSAVLTTLSSSFVAFGLARLRGRGKNVVFGLLIGTMMLPGIVTTIPVFIMYAKLRMLDTYWPWVFGGLAGSAYLIFLIRQSYMSIPTELEEAAIMDGCGYFGIWWRMYLPLSKAVLACAFVLTFVGSWGDYLFPRLILTQEKTTLAVAIASGYVDESLHPIVQLIAAGSLLFALPVILVFLLLQRYFVSGFATSGLK